jgi:phosphonate utilization transcriptional regulator
MDSSPDARSAASPLEILQSHSLTMLVKEELERMIVAGELAAGAKLNEIALATRLGVSRGPVREAFRALQEAGLVRVEKNRGVFVRQVSLEEADEIFELRAVLEAWAGRRVAERSTPLQVKALRGLVERMEKAAARRDVDAYHPLNLQFHDALVEAAGNAKLTAAYRRLVNELNLFRRQTLARDDRLPESVREHRRILEAVATGDAAAAARLLQAHAMESRERMHLARSAAVVPLTPRSSRRSNPRKSR